MSEQGGKIDDVNFKGKLQRELAGIWVEATVEHINGRFYIWKTKHKINEVKIISKSALVMWVSKWIKVSIKVMAGLNKGV